MYDGVDTLTRLYDSFHADSVVLCFDECTHIHNNQGKLDDRAPPLCGNNERIRTMSALDATGYPRPLTLETPFWYVTDDLLLSFTRHNYDSLAYPESLTKPESI